ncbi:MAG TPA: hypothetical protein VFD68_00650, partial [Gemmatimonadales bacterium]|nr:hypothetical protein [Gemmatimonadales bacterium]
MLLASVVTGCASTRVGIAPVAGRAQPVPAAGARESLHVTVVYPAATDVIQSHDSAFLFGAVRGGGGGAGARSLTIDGRPVPVRANGAWIAWLPLPDDTLAPFRLI